MPAASTEIPVGFACDPCLSLGNWLDDKLGFFDDIVKTAAGDRIAAPVNNNCRLHEIDRSDAAVRCGFNRSRTAHRFRLVAKDRDQRGTIGGHRGNPRSS